MKKTNTYYIDVFKLSNAVHEYKFEVSDPFFTMFENSELSRGEAEVFVHLNKSETMMSANFKIKGHVELVCDRSLELYNHTINTSNTIIFKYGNDWEEISDEIIIVPRDIQRIDMTQYIYEFIGLAVPMKKLHPKFEHEDLDDERLALVYTSSETQDGESIQNKDTDPRWSILKEIRNKK